MNCETSQQTMILAHYGELPDEMQLPLEQHLNGCADCRREWNALIALNEELATLPVVEPSPNLLAASRMRLDEALDAIPPRSAGQRFLGHAFRWLGFLQGAPALATLLLGVGFLSGNILNRYQVAHAPRLPSTVVLNGGTGPIASVSGIVQTPNSEVVQVNYNRLVPESVQGSLDDPQIRHLLMLGTTLASSGEVHANSVDLLAKECIAGHDCESSGQPDGIRGTLITSLRSDRNSAVRLKALTGLQPYVADDENVRDAVLDAVLRDHNPDVRAQAISMLTPVHADTSVREVLRSVSTRDVNPAVRNASFQVLQGASDIQ
ncbi:HEAT repeat-containing protein [Bryocella elongata]|uniref:HEAT repeat-containing protein n=1 Tax=Bryocella elongata TaxID=863522 RepID=A0A1H6BKI3_9BACT|nr:HEAT repeat domain-containing protein [Bryocella elongata]SEG60716.1 HEAT repeat-containing protein [Bryocella elongata]